MWLKDGSHTRGCSDLLHLNARPAPFALLNVNGGAGQVLLEEGSCREAEDLYGGRPLHTAVKCGAVEVGLRARNTQSSGREKNTLLVGAKARPFPSLLSLTPAFAHFAPAHTLHLGLIIFVPVAKVVALLLSAGADREALNGDRQSPCVRCRERERERERERWGLVTHT